jgi:anti-sigma regulatory factor (Ser/Thr protein kinase)
LGGLPDISHIDDAVVMGCGDTLLIYTDGVTDSRIDEFSGRLEEEGLRQLMCGCPSRYPEAVADYLLRNLGQADDDIALMVVQVATEPSYTGNFDPEPAMVAGLRREMERFAERFSKVELYNLKVMISEMTTNAIRHGARRPGDHFTISWWEEEEFLRVLIENPGPAFSPDPQIDHDTPGGRGIWLVSELADRWGVTCHNSEVQVWAEKHWEK